MAYRKSIPTDWQRQRYQKRHQFDHRGALPPSAAFTGGAVLGEEPAYKVPVAENSPIIATGSCHNKSKQRNVEHAAARIRWGL